LSDWVILRLKIKAVRDFPIAKSPDDSIDKFLWLT